MLAYLQGILVVVFEVVLYVMYMDIFIKSNRKQSIVERMLIKLVMITAAYIIILIFYRYALLKSIILSLIMTLIIIISYSAGIKKEGIKCFVLTCFYHGFLISVDYLVLITIYALVPYESIENMLVQSVMVVLSKLILFFVILVLQKIIVKDSNMILSGGDWIRFLIVPIFSIAIIIYMLTRMTTIMIANCMELIWVLAFGILGLNIFLFYLIQGIAKREYKLSENKILEIKANNQLLLYQNMSDNFDKQNRKMHEYKNRIECLTALCRKNNYAELEQYLEQISEGVAHDVDYVDTHNAMVNVVINQKYREMMEDNIVAVLQLSDLSGLWIAQKDIVVILANLLDNAIEACRKLESRRVIKIKMVIENEKLLLSVRNTYNGEYIREQDNFVTTKTEDTKEHGIGLKNVIQTLEKYGGTYDIATEPEFSVVIMVPKSLPVISDED